MAVFIQKLANTNLDDYVVLHEIHIYGLDSRNWELEVSVTLSSPLAATIELREAGLRVEDDSGHSSSRHQFYF